MLEADLAELGFLENLPPSSRIYSYILLNGTTAPNVRKRINEVARAVASGAIRLTAQTQTVLRDGERKLVASETTGVQAGSVFSTVIRTLQ